MYTEQTSKKERANHVQNDQDKHGVPNACLRYGGSSITSPSYPQRNRRACAHPNFQLAPCNVARRKYIMLVHLFGTKIYYTYDTMVDKHATYKKQLLLCRIRAMHVICIGLRRRVYLAAVGNAEQYKNKR